VTSRPRIIIGNLEPILALGLDRVLSEDGLEVLAQESDAGRIVGEAERLHPDAVVLDLNNTEAAGVAHDVRRASPSTKVVLWASDETVMEVLDPFSDVMRFVAAAGPKGLSSELTETRPRVKE
jgi:DNA-binding NarL/FixJ family response regulator